MGVDERQLLDTIYAAAIDPSLWTVALARLAEAIGSEAAGITRLHILTGAGHAIVLNNDARTLSDYFDYYYRINPLQLVDDATGYTAGWTPKILRDDEWLDRETLEASEFYNDFLEPIGAQWGLILRMGLSGHELTAINIGRDHRRGRFEDDEVALMARLHPHLIRAIDFGERLSAVHQRADGLAAAMDRSRSAMMLVDANAVLLHANAAAEQMMQTGEALCLRDRRLAARDPAGDRALSAAIRGAARSGREGRIAGSFSLPARGSADTVDGLAMPLLEDSAGLFGRGAAALVSVNLPIADATAMTETFGDLLGLTTAEARLATDLVRGLDLRASAARRGTTINTVRTQLSSIFAKTGTHRQVDLVRLLTMTDATGFDG